MATKKYKPLPVENLKMHSRGREVHSNHASILCEIVLASYDEYTALVKSGNVVSKHVKGWRV